MYLWFICFVFDHPYRRTRTSTPVTQGPEDDVTLSSGDESDNADLTEGESSGDEWSDFDGKVVYILNAPDMANLLSRPV